MQSINIKKVKEIDILIQQQNTGKPGEFARKLDMSVSNLHYLLRLLREELNAPIVYDRQLKSYRYSTAGSIVLDFVKDENI
ncbi:hypothetical protein GCM10009122_57590 [Fulvivirga kasyanovii]|uniref:Uncharacterized protein n=1 Tax=Fulvivirga kasyanovii TaxID=396812 RepID=A0ABW9RL50_9BACT|nr:hypothetical protein [Fulvivirga kasyanovii]MTI23930.1 hypothetical protein [Fulvivirga kasyanovii]